MADARRVSAFIQRELQRRDQQEATAVEAAKWLDDAGVLADSQHRRGKPLRDLLRARGLIEGQRQESNARWFIDRVRTGAVDSDVTSRSSGRGTARKRRAVGEDGAPRQPSTELEELRRRYFPEQVRVLFVGESPPAGGTFFYSANSNLYYATRDAFVDATDRFAKESFLDEFAASGCYLDDLCLAPVNDLALKDPRRIAARRAGEHDLAERIREWQPLVVVTVMIAIQSNVASAVPRARLVGAPHRALPFPGRQNHGERYVEMLTALVHEWLADGRLK